MRFRLFPAVAVLVATAAAADEAHIVMPVALAARVELGGRQGLSIAAEPRGSGALVTVSQVVRPLAAPPRLPLADAEECGDPAALDRPADLSFPAELQAVGSRSEDALDAVTAVVAYVSRRIALDESDQAPQDAISVLQRGRARCSGRANLAIGWLRSLGIPARAVHGIMLADAGPRWHRWGEAWLGPLGWVPFDPGGSVGVVSVRYLPMRGASEGAALNGVALIGIDERGFAALPRRGDLRVPPVGGASLRCIAASADTGIAAMLLGPDGTRWARRGAGQVTFAGLLPGRYLLRWTPNGTGVGQAALVLDGAREVRIEGEDAP